MKIDHHDPPRLVIPGEAGLSNVVMLDTVATERLDGRVHLGLDVHTSRRRAVGERRAGPGEEHHVGYGGKAAGRVVVDKLDGT